MILNTFSGFDLIIKTKLILLLLLYIYAVTSSNIQILWKQPSTRLHPQLLAIRIVSNLRKTNTRKLMLGGVSLITPLFTLVASLNLGGILPYAPSLTAHLILDLSLCLPIWTRIVIWSALSPSPSLAHYLPESSLDKIAPFLSSVEGVRSIIRPLTLSFRLSANISAGHVIITITGTTIVQLLLSALTILGSIISLVLAGYFTFELAICLVQAFVLMLLSTIYTTDYLTKNKSPK